MTAPTVSISAAASISRSPPRTASNPAAPASMAAATGCASARSSSASTACAATSRASPSPNAPISSGSDRQLRVGCRQMSTRNMKTVTVSLPPQLVAELDRVRERERRTRSEILRDALRRYITVAERGRMIPIEDALPEEIEAMRRADEEYVRGECVRLEDLQHELGIKPR